MTMLTGGIYNEWTVYTDSGDGRTNNFKEPFNREIFVMKCIIIDGRRTWVAVENMTQEQKRAYDGQVNPPSEVQLQEQERARELRVLTTSPAQWRKYLQQKKRNR